MKKKIIYLSALCTLMASKALFAQNVYGTFENWHSFTSGGTSLEAPQNWYGADSILDFIAPLAGATAQKQVVKSTSAHGGTYAASVVTKYYGGQLDTVPGVLVNAQPSVNIATQTISYSNFTAVSSRITSMTAWVKYAPAASNDAGDIEIDLLKSGIGAGGADSLIGDGYVTVHTLANFTNITIPVSYVNPTIVPDKVLITFTSSGDSDAVAIGSTMTIDDVTLQGPSGIAIPVFGQKAVQCFPNPSTGVINFITASTAPLTITAYSTDGRNAGSYTFTGNGRFDLQNQPAGNYFYRIADQDGHLIQAGSFLLQQ